MSFADFTLTVWTIIIALPVAAVALVQLPARWKLAEACIWTSLALAALEWIRLALFAGASVDGTLLRATPLSATLVLLISFIALMVLRFARSNFAWDPDEQRFLRWLLATYAAVVVTVTANHLLLFWCAWASISLSLHQLLMFYPERPRANLAAHKKFLFARFAETLLAAALILLYTVYGTANVSELLASIGDAPLVWQEQLAAILIANVALVKCAQLPVHGWLIQVVECPTPVSALLHAGVINLGGFLLLLFAPLFSLATAAQWFVLIVSGLTTGIAALVMSTRISIKVRLAWSTTAQMGLMLVECALGLYELALLHLCAHSCYKAYAFLNAGTAVEQNLMMQLAPRALPPLKAWVVSALLVLPVVLLGPVLLGAHGPVSPWLLIGLAMVVVCAERYGSGQTAPLLRCISVALGMMAAYVGWKFLAGRLLPDLTVSYHPSMDLFACAVFTLMLGAWLLLRYRPAAPFSRKLFIALNAGFYLDEWATRTTLNLWPLIVPRSSKKSSIDHKEAIV